jgi:hypothetical protein
VKCEPLISVETSIPSDAIAQARIHLHTTKQYCVIVCKISLRLIGWGEREGRSETAGRQVAQPLSPAT